MLVNPNWLQIFVPDGVYYPTIDIVSLQLTHAEIQTLILSRTTGEFSKLRQPYSNFFLDFCHFVSCRLMHPTPIGEGL